MRAAAVGAALAAALLLTGCAGRGGDGAPDANAALHVARDGEPVRLDPAFIKDQYESFVSGLMHEGLVRFGSGDDVIPGLATHWEVTTDSLTYTFHLRKDSAFSDGRPVTAADVRYSFTRILRPDTNSDRKWVLNRIAGADAVTSSAAVELSGLDTPDTHTVRITLDRPYPVFLKMLAMPTAAIIPAGSAGEGKPDGSYDASPVGAGPWVLAQWQRGRHLEFRANGSHHDAPALPRLFVHVASDAAVARQQFEVGNHDIIPIDFAAYPAWSADAKKRRLMRPVQELRTDFLGLMCHKPPFSDPSARRAVALILDRKAIFENLQKGRGVPARGPVPPGIEGYRPREGYPRRDPEYAMPMLVEAGAMQRELELWYRDEGLTAEVAASIQRDLEYFGMKVRLVVRDLAAFRAAIWEGAPDMFIGSWTLDYPDIENALVPPFHSRNIPRQGNQTRFSSPEVDALLEQAEREADPQARIALFQKAEDLIMRAPPWVPLFHRRTDYAVQPWVKDYEPALLINADRYTSVTLQGAPAR